jgi:hypothetical protein
MDGISGMARWRARYESQIQQGPNGFDYAGVIQVLEKPFLKLSAEPTEIEVRCDYSGNECGHMTTLCIISESSLVSICSTTAFMRGAGKVWAKVNFSRRQSRRGNRTDEDAFSGFCARGFLAGTEHQFPCKGEPPGFDSPSMSLGKPCPAGGALAS